MDRVFECGPYPPNYQPPSTRTSLRIVGRVDAFTVYDLEYFFGDETAPALRSILVRVASGGIHEVQVRENSSGGTFSPAQIICVRQQCLIGVKWDDGGNAHYVYEDYFVLTKDGAIPLDFTPVLESAERVVPTGMATYQPTVQFDFNDLILRVGTEKRDPKVSAKLACCTGRVEVQFRIADGHVIPGQATYFEW